MDFDTFMRERVRAPMYGTAPGGLIAAHQEVVRQMERLYYEGISLTDETMLELCKKASELSAEIADFNKQKV